MPIGAAIGTGIAGIAGAGASIYGANNARDAQVSAANAANAQQQQGINFQQGNINAATGRLPGTQQYINDQLGIGRDAIAGGQAGLAPWMNNGANASNTLAMMTGTNPGGDPMTAQLTSRFAPTIDTLSKTPGYQWSLDQGLKATQNSYASKGLGSSGAAMKGAADYAEGLAGTTFQQQYQNYWGENKSIFDMLTGQSAAGAGAAGNIANLGVASANLGSNAAGMNTNAVTGLNGQILNAGTGIMQGYGQQGQNTIGSGNAIAASDMAQANAFGSGANAIAGGMNNYMQYNLLQQLLARGNTNGTPNFNLGNMINVNPYQVPVNNNGMMM